MATNNLATVLGSDCVMPISGSFQITNGVNLLLQDMQMLLLTVPGERLNRPTFGCNLRNQIWENIDNAAINGATDIKSALTRFEPRIKVVSVTSTINRNTSLVTFVINFVVIQTNTSLNLVFPFRVGTELSQR